MRGRCGRPGWRRYRLTKRQRRSLSDIRNAANTRSVRVQLLFGMATLGFRLFLPAISLIGETAAIRHLWEQTRTNRPICCSERWSS